MTDRISAGKLVYKKSGVYLKKFYGKEKSALCLSWKYLPFPCSGSSDE